MGTLNYCVNNYPHNVINYFQNKKIILYVVLVERFSIKHKLGKYHSLYSLIQQ